MIYIVKFDADGLPIERKGFVFTPNSLPSDEVEVSEADFESWLDLRRGGDGAIVRPSGAA